MAPRQSAAVSPVVALVVRILTLISLLTSLVMLVTNTATTNGGAGGDVKLEFKDFYAYRYMLVSMSIGIVYTLLQTAFKIFQVKTGNRIGGKCLYQIDFYGDKVISYFLATGAAAGFGLAVDMNRVLRGYFATISSMYFNESATIYFFDFATAYSHFRNKANKAASHLLLGFLFSAASSVFSSLSVPKRS